MRRRGRRGAARTVAGRIAAVVTVAGAGWLAVWGLREAGFRFRWEVPAPAPGERPRGVGERAPLTTGPRAADPGEPSAAVRPRLAPPPSGGRPIGSGAAANIDFDRLPDGADTCAPCPISDEWADEGLVVSFRSWSAGSTRPMVLDARDYLPVGRPGRALGPAFLRERGLEVGVIRLDFPGRPRRVSFSLFGPDLVRRFEVVAWSGGAALDPARVRRTVSGRYDAGGTFREERITVTMEEGIDRISLDGWGPPGHLLLVDDLEIIP